MEFTGSRKSKKPIKINNRFNVESKKSVIKSVIAIIFTSIMWMYSFIVFYVFVSGLLDYNNSFIGIIKIGLKVTNEDIIGLTNTFIILFFISFIVLISWRLYNKKRFGNLNRRMMPKITVDEDILNLKLIDYETYQILKIEKIIIFEKNPVRELGEGIKEFEKDN